MKITNYDWIIGLLIDMGMLTFDQVEKFKGASGTEAGIVNELLKNKIISQIQLATALAAQFGTEVVSLDDLTIDPALIALIKPKFAWAYGIIPVEKRGETIFVVTNDPSDVRTFDDLNYIFKLDVHIRITTSDQLKKALLKYYPSGEEEGMKYKEQLQASSADWS